MKFFITDNIDFSTKIPERNYASFAHHNLIEQPFVLNPCNIMHSPHQWKAVQCTDYCKRATRGIFNNFDDGYTRK